MICPLQTTLRGPHQTSPPNPANESSDSCPGYTVVHKRSETTRRPQTPAVGMSDSLQAHGLYSPWYFPGQNTGVHNLSFLQGTFPTQRLTPGLPHCRQILYQLNHMLCLPLSPKRKPSGTWDPRIPYRWPRAHLWGLVAFSLALIFCAQQCIQDSCLKMH